MSKYGVDYTSNNGKGIVRADGFVIGGVAKAPAVVISTTITFDPPSLATATPAVSSGITVTGVALGDHIDLFPPYNTQGIIYSASPSAANTIIISLFNASAGTVDLASGTWGVVVTRRA